MKKILLISLIFISAFAIVKAQLNTTGYENWRPLYNSMVTWEDGAFNMNQSGHPDYGWGVYNSISHGLSGDSIYLIKLQDGTLKQLFIEEKNSMGNIYKFRFADITGENEVVAEARCVDYTNRLFLYYSLQNQTFVDRDPANADWDIVLTKYTDTAINYTVTGFLSNEDVEVSVYHAPNSTAAANSTINDTTTFKKDITAIGNSWNKVVGFSIVPLDTMVYFVKTSSLSVYKMQATFFESGSAAGTGKGRVGLAVQLVHPSVGEIMKDTLVMGNGYANDVYFSMAQGVTKTSPRNTWDIAFKANAFSASILLNTTMNMALYTYPKAFGEGIEAWDALAVKNISLDQTSVYPNPVANSVVFSNKNWRQNSDLTFELFDSSGKLVLKQVHSLDGNSFTTDLNQLSNGIYQARVLNNGNYFNTKVLVSK